MKKVYDLLHVFFSLLNFKNTSRMSVMTIVAVASMAAAALLTTTPTIMMRVATATTGIGSDGGPISSVQLEGWPEETDHLHYTTYAIRLLGVGDDGLTKPVASDARLNLVLIANLPPGFSNDPSIDQLVTYNQTIDVNATDFIEYRECSITCEPETLYIWRINKTDIRAEIPQPIYPQAPVWPPEMSSSRYAHDAYNIIMLTATLPSGDVITTTAETDKPCLDCSN